MRCGTDLPWSVESTILKNNSGTNVLFNRSRTVDSCSISIMLLFHSELEQTLEQRTAELHAAQTALKEKEQELQRCLQELQEHHSALEERLRELETCQQDAEVSRTALKELEDKLERNVQELKDSQGMVKHQEQELMRVREVLRRTEEELDQRVAHMNERCLSMEEERGSD